MVGVNVHITGGKEAVKLLVNLPKAMEKEIYREGTKFNRLFQKSAKLRAPRMTGRLANSIKVKKRNKEIILVVDSPYARYQEEGFAPHWVHSGMNDRMGGTVGGTMGKEGFFFVQKHTPFIKPALEMSIAKLPKMLLRGTQKAIREAKR